MYMYSLHMQSRNFTCNCYASLLQFSCQDRTRIKTIRVKVITFVLHSIYKCKCQSCFLPVIHAHIVDVSCYTVSKNECLYPVWIGLALQILPETNTTCESNDRFIDGYLLCWCKCTLKELEQDVNERLDFVTLTLTINITNVKHSKDLEKPVTREDRTEEWNIREVISAPVVLEGIQLYQTHVEYHINKGLHLLHCHWNPVPVNRLWFHGHLADLLRGILIRSVYKVLPQVVIEEQ